MSAMAARQSSMASFSMANASLFPQFPLYPYVIFSNLLLLLSVVFNLLSSLYICIHIDFTCHFSILIFFLIVVAYLFAAFWELPVLCWANDLMHKIL